MNNNEMYLINTCLGMFLKTGKSASDAFARYCTEESKLENSFLTRERLVELGFMTIEKTPLNNVFILRK